MSIVDLYPVLRIPLAFLLDVLIGEPKWLLHPVTIIGKIITGCEKVFRFIFPKTKHGERAAGICMIFVVCTLSFAFPYGVLYVLKRLARHFYLPWLTYAACALDIFWGYQAIAARGLRDEAHKVYKSLMLSIEEARKAVGKIVGRDTIGLDDEGVVRAAVETVAENTTDGVVSPLIFFAIGGTPLAFLYKAINTMDSMTGYTNEKYINFGRYPAKLDDIVNFIPARIAALLMLLSSVVCQPIPVFPLRYSPYHALKVFVRDRYNHASPNSAQTESVCAGALDIQLGGDAVYQGVVEHHPLIGDSIKKPDSIDIERAIMLMYITSIITMAICTIVRFVIAVHS